MRGCVRALPAPRRSRFRCAVWACLLGSGFRLRPATPWGGVGVCVCSCARPAWSPAPPGWGYCAEVCGWCCAPPLLAGASGCVCVCARAPLVPHLSWLGCAVWACVLGLGLGCAPPFLVGLSGCVFFWEGCALLWLCGVGRWLSLSRALWSLPPHPLSFGLGCWLFFFSSQWVPVLAFLGLVWRLCVGAGAVCRGPSPAPAVGSGCVSPGWGLLVVVCPPVAPFACPPPSFSSPRRFGRCSPGALPGPTRLWWMGGGGVLDAGSGSFPWCFPLGGPMLALPVRV